MRDRQPRRVEVVDEDALHHVPVTRVLRDDGAERVGTGLGLSKGQVPHRAMSQQLFIKLAQGMVVKGDNLLRGIPGENRMVMSKLPVL